MSDTAGAQIVSPTSTEEAVQLLTSTQHRKVTLGANLANFQRGMGASDLLDPDRLCISLQELMVALPLGSRNEEWAFATQNILAALVGLTSLTVLGIPLGKDGPGAIAQRLPNLTSLSLSASGIGDQGAAAIAERLPKLRCSTSGTTSSAPQAP